MTALLSQMPIATILINPAREIVLYGSQAAQVLSRIAPSRLKASLSDYFDLGPFQESVARLSETGGEGPVHLSGANGTHVFEGRVKSLGDGGHMVLIDMPEAPDSPIEARPLVYDFDLLNQAEIRDVADTPLSQLCFVAFDTEITGLSTETDDIVQIGAVRIVGRRIVEDEIIDTYVDPGRPIPPPSAQIHGVTDADVSAAPDVLEAGRALF